MEDTTPSVTEYLRTRFNADVKEVNGDGTFNVVRKDSKGNIYEGKVDARAMLMEELTNRGIEVDPSKIPLTSPESPVGESSLPFMTQYNLAKAVTAKDKLNYLSQELGKDNVRILGDGRISVKTEDGIWSEGKTNSALSALVSTEGAAIAGSIAGAKIGAAAGSVFPGAGTVIGGALGAGLGAVVGKLASISDAYRMGIRSDFDAKDIGGELAKDFLFAAAGESIVGALAKAPSAVKSAKVMDAFEGIGRGPRKFATNSPAKKEFIASTLSQMSGVEQPVFRFAMEPETTGFMKAHFDEAVKYVQEAGAVPIEQSPLMKSTEEKLLGVIDFAKNKMQRDHGAMLEVLKRPMFEAFIPADDLLKRIPVDAIQANRQLAAGSVEGNLYRQLAKRLNLSANVNETALASGWKGASAEDILDVSKWLDGELSKRFKPGMALNEQYVGQLSQLNNDLKSIVAEKLQGKLVELPGNAASQLKSILGKEGTNLDLMQVSRGKYKADELFGFMQNTYSRRADFLSQISRQADPAKVGSMATRMMEEGGAATRGSLTSMLDDVGLDGKTLVNEMYGKYAAMRTAHWVNPSRTSSGVLNAVANVAGGPFGTSPRMAARYAMGLSDGAFTTIKRGARVTDFLQNLSPKARQMLLDSPQLLKELDATAGSERAMFEQLKQQLMQKGTQAVRGGGQ